MKKKKQKKILVADIYELKLCMLAHFFMLFLSSADCFQNYLFKIQSVKLFVSISDFVCLDLAKVISRLQKLQVES